MEVASSSSTLLVVVKSCDCDKGQDIINSGMESDFLLEICVYSMYDRRKRRVLKLATKAEIAIPGTPRWSLKVKKVSIGMCMRMESKVHHISGQVVPLLRR